MRRGRRLV